MTRTLLRLAHYTEEQVGDADKEEVGRMYAEAATLCKCWDKVHYHYGRFHDNHLRRSLANARRP